MTRPLLGRLLVLILCVGISGCNDDLLGEETGDVESHDLLTKTFEISDASGRNTLRLVIASPSRELLDLHDAASFQVIPVYAGGSTASDWNGPGERLDALGTAEPQPGEAHPGSMVGLGYEVLAKESAVAGFTIRISRGPNAQKIPPGWEDIVYYHFPSSIRRKVVVSGHYVTVYYWHYIWSWQMAWGNWLINGNTDSYFDCINPVGFQANIRHDHYTDVNWWYGWTFYLNC